MLEFFEFEFFLNFCLPGLRKFFPANFFWKNHTCFWGHAPVKKGGESNLKDFFDYEKKFRFFFGRRKAGTTEGGNDGTRERLE